METKGLHCEIIKEGIIIIIVKNDGDLNQDASCEGSKKKSNSLTLWKKCQQVSLVDWN